MKTKLKIAMRIAFILFVISSGVCIYAHLKDLNPLFLYTVITSFLLGVFTMILLRDYYDK